MSIKIHDLTPELREKLAKYLPIPITAKFDYTPKGFSDLPVDQRPIFHLKTLDGVTMTRSIDHLWHGNLNDSNFTRGEYIVFVTNNGVEGWDNFFIEYKNKNSLAELSPELLSELCDAIVEKKQLSEDEQLGLK